ncbi:MFS transporter [Actinomyces gerencseriae]|uniref:MFS transporter n=1 Tax=Actinomyces gerencseriae TaxID=52769 RepID=UPI0028EA0C01|nr:MFS transporter [Actinomyces gerencseriae]
MTPPALQICYSTTSTISTTVSNCADVITATSGDEEVRTSGGLSGAGLSLKASNAADSVSTARRRFSFRLTDHSTGIYDATRGIAAADEAAAADVPRLGDY